MEETASEVIKTQDNVPPPGPVLSPTPIRASETPVGPSPVPSIASIERGTSPPPQSIATQVCITLVDLFIGIILIKNGIIILYEFFFNILDL